MAEQSPLLPRQRHGLVIVMFSRLPDRLANSVRFEWSIVTLALKTVLRRPLPDVSCGYSHTRRSSWGQVMLALLLLTFLELPALHFLIATFTNALWIHALVGLIHVWGLLWLLADWRALRETCHRISSDALELCLGFRWTGTVSLENIAGVEALAEESDVNDSADPRGLPVLKVTPFEAPNVVIDLHREAVLTGIYGIQKSARELRLYVDEPERFTQALKNASSA